MGLGQSLQRLGVTSMRLAHQRLELAALDVEEEVLHWGSALLALLVTALLGALALAAAAAAIVVYFWDSARMTALIGVTSVFAGAAMYTGRRLAASLRDKPAFLSGTLDELRKDAQHLEPTR